MNKIDLPNSELRIWIKCPNCGKQYKQIIEMKTKSTEEIN